MDIIIMIILSVNCVVMCGLYVRYRQLVVNVELILDIVPEVHDIAERRVKEEYYDDTMGIC